MKLLGDPNEQLDINTSVNWVWNITTVNIFFFVVLCFYSMGAPVMVELEGQTDPLQIAMKELKWESLHV